jgi:hypothetical protein
MDLPKIVVLHILLMLVSFYQDCIRTLRTALVRVFITFFLQYSGKRRFLDANLKNVLP